MRMKQSTKKPHLLVQPRILIPKQAINANATDGSPSQPVATSVLNANETIDEKRHLLIQPQILIAKPVINANATDGSLPQPVATSVKITEVKSEVEKNLGEFNLELLIRTTANILQMLL